MYEVGPREKSLGMGWEEEMGVDLLSQTATCQSSKKWSSPWLVVFTMSRYGMGWSTDLRRKGSRIFMWRCGSEFGLTILEWRD